MVGWHHWLNGHEFEQALGDAERQGNLACCSSWRGKESETNELAFRGESHGVSCNAAGRFVFL